MFRARRFWSRVNFEGPVHPTLGTPCWVWLGTTNEKGYGLITYAGRKVLVHRLSWLLEHQVWSDLSICHHCDNPPCVRPDHLFEGTQQDNINDMISKGRSKISTGGLWYPTTEGWVQK